MAAIPDPLSRHTLVMKFGGTSVGTPAAMTQVVRIVRSEKPRWQNLVVVTSALSGVTDLLLRMVRDVAVSEETFRADGAELLQRHAAIADALIPDADRRRAVMGEIGELAGRVVNLCQAVAVLGEATPRVMDAVASTGERMCVRLLAAALNSEGVAAEAVEATQLIRTDDHYTDAHPDLETSYGMTRQGLAPLLAHGSVPVVTGFIASTAQGNVTTLGRGGSDYSAALIGAALPADDVWIYTDVDGVMTADPRLVADAFTVPVCSYREVSELAFYGAKVLHPKTIRPVIEAGIGLRVCNTFNPDHPGTRLVAELEQQRGVIKAITTVRDLRLVTVEGRGMLGVPGVAARAFETIARLGTSVPLFTQSSSEQSICFAVPAGATDRVVEKLTETFAHEIYHRDIDSVWATDEVGIVTVVGAGMKSTPGVSGRIFNALGMADVNVIAIAQGSSEVSISLVVGAADIKTALRVLHALILRPEKSHDQEIHESHENGKRENEDR
ncbi:aspartate kinase [Longilinea arvoryzae]|uniref:Aspartokinase n=1 Tax=Longilinea arvoryzae TaxID=360412 RepID=A0A0S7B7H6_9CHLR|nr:aspartate kinase [Longilinea arvoryzae]GAP13356.1 aspartate kinase [Longilinea arvoryzae]